MSLFGLRGRKFLDALQHHPSFPSSRFRLPCPPYDNPAFWDQLYKDMTYDMVNEWGGVDLAPPSGLLQFQYQKVPVVLSADNANDDNNNIQQDDGIIATAAWADWMGINQLSSPEDATRLYQQQQQSDNENEAILILGCGNSKLGEQFLTHSFVGPILQLDISSKVIQLMTQRYHDYLSSDDSVVKRMEFFVDDASTGLTSLEPESVGGGVIDKGLLDVLHCSAGPMMKRDDADNNDADNNDDDMIQRILGSVHNVLQPSRPFIFFSRSEPQWMLRRVLGSTNNMLWKDVEALKLVDFDLFLYKLIKAEDDYFDRGVHDKEQTTGREESVINMRSYHLNRRKGGGKKSKR